MRNNAARKIAFGGMFAALAVVILSLGGLIPVATFVCPLLCMLILAFVVKMCGGRIGWAWYGVVAILGALLGPDKEACAVFIFLGYYPMLKQKLDSLLLGWLLKGLFFNSAILLMYWVLIWLLGVGQIAAEYQQMGMIMTVLMLVLGNVTFFLTDKVLSRFEKIK